MNVQTCPNCRIEVELTDIGRCPRCRELVESKAEELIASPYCSPNEINETDSFSARRRDPAFALACALVSAIAAFAIIGVVAFRLNVGPYIALPWAAGGLITGTGLLAGVFGVIGGIRNRSYVAISVAGLSGLFHGWMLTMLIGALVLRSLRG
jgi:hypothetical protein